MNKSKRNTIIRFTLNEYIKSKFFIIFNIISLLGMIIGMNFHSFIKILNIPEESVKYNIMVIDNSNIINNKFVETFDYSGDFEISKITENTYTKDNINAEDIIIEITSKEEEHFKATITSKQALKDEIEAPIKKALTQIQREMLQNDFKITKDESNLLIKGLDLESVYLSVVSEGYFEKILIKYLAGAVTLFVAMLIFSKIGQDIAQEKQSKSSEYILTTVSPKEYLFAKVFGNILFVIIQFLLMIVYVFIGLAISSLLRITQIDASTLSEISTKAILSKDIISLIVALFIYNILTLILLSFVQGGLSAKTTSIQDAGNSSLLILTTYSILFILTMSIIDQYTTPNLLLNVVSVLPVISSFFIPALMIIGQCSIWQIVVSLILLIVSIPFTFNICQKKFKEGILNYSKFKKSSGEESSNPLSETQKLLNKRKYKQIGNTIGLGIIIYLGLNFIVSILAQSTVPVILDGENQTNIMLIVQIIVSIITLFITYKYFTSRVEVETNTEEGTKSNNKISKVILILLSLGLISALQIVLTFVFSILGLGYDVTNAFNIQANPDIRTKLLIVLAIAVMPAIFEELLCRKAIFSYLRPYGKAFAIVTSAIIFGLIHLNLQQFIFAFLVGLILGYLYESTKDLKVTMIVHFINNFLGTLPFLLKEHADTISLIVLGLFIIVAVIIFLVLIKTKKIKIKLSNPKINLAKYKPMFSDYMLDVSLIAILFLSIYQESLLKILN